MRGFLILTFLTACTACTPSTLVPEGVPFRLGMAEQEVANLGCPLISASKLPGGDSPCVSLRGLDEMCNRLDVMLPSIKPFGDVDVGVAGGKVTRIVLGPPLGGLPLGDVIAIMRRRVGEPTHDEVGQRWSTDKERAWIVARKGVFSCLIVAQEVK